MRTAISQARRSGAFVGLKDLVRPQQLPSLAAWYDVSDTSSMLRAYNTAVSSGNPVMLVADKSGNSAVNVLCLNGVAGNYASVPDAAALRLSSALDIDAQLLLPSWATGTQTVAARWDTANTSYLFWVNATGNLELYLFNSSEANATSSVAVPFSALGSGWVRATWRASDTRCQFFTSTDGISWTQLGTDQVINKPSIAAGTAPLGIGATTTGTANRLTGNVGRVRIYNAIREDGGSLVLDSDFAGAAKLAASFTCTTGQTVTINSTGATGARICGARDLYQGTAANQPTYLPWNGTNYGYLNGTGGNYYSSPNAAPLQITGDLDLRWYGSLVDWTPAARAVLISKYNSTGNQRGYWLAVTTGGNLELNQSTDGTAVSTFTSSVATGITDGALKWVRVTLDVDNGAAGRTVTFYTSDDGSTWTPLGTAQIVATATNTFNCSATLNIGGNDAGAFNVPFAQVYRAQVYSGIAGTLAFDFNPSAYTSGTTFLDSAGGATITLNGGSTIVRQTCLYIDGVNDFLRSPAFSLPQPVSRYTVGKHVSWTSGDYLLDGATAANGAALIQTTSTPQLNLNAGSSVAANTGLVLQTISVIAEVFNGAASFLTIARQAATTGDAGAGAPNGVTIGASGAATAANFGNMTISEHLVYAAAHKTNFSLRILMWLWRKWKPAFNI